MNKPVGANDHNDDCGDEGVPVQFRQDPAEAYSAAYSITMSRVASSALSLMIACF